MRGHGKANVWILRVLVSFFVLLSSCSGTPELPVGDPETEAIADQTYLLNPDDVVRVSFWREPELSRDSIVIQPDGALSLPLVGQIQAAGRSMDQVRNEIKAKIQPYVPNAVVSIELIDARGNLVFVTGEVSAPGTYKVTGRMTIVQAITLAGGFSPFADDDNIEIIRRADGQTYRVDYDDLVSGSVSLTNQLVKAGDQIVVGKGSFF